MTFICCREDRSFSCLFFLIDRVQPYPIDLSLMRIHQQLTALVGLIAVEASLCKPLPGNTGNLFDTLDAGCSGIHVGIRSKTDG